MKICRVQRVFPAIQIKYLNMTILHLEDDYKYLENPCKT